MDSQPWHERLVQQLHQQHLPASYIDRLVEELADHAVDLQQENASMDAQQSLQLLGSAADLAAVAGREFRQHTFAGRHPWLTFVAGPVAFVPVLFVMLIVGFTGVGWVLDAVIGSCWCSDEVLQLPLSETEARIEWWFITGFDCYVRFGPFVLAAWVFSRWARRSELRRWGLAACVIVALIAGLLSTKSVPSHGENPGLWMIGLTFQPHLRQLVQFVVPLALGCWLLGFVPRLFMNRAAAVSG
jgi:hypothetical protein